MTVSVKFVLRKPKSRSATPSVMVVVPDAFVVGVMESKRLVPLPVMLMFVLVLATRPVFDEVAVTTRLLGAVSMSETVSVIGPRPESSGIVWLVMPEMKGKAFPGD